MKKVWIVQDGEKVFGCFASFEDAVKWVNLVNTRTKYQINEISFYESNFF